jgi:uncharacterized membrane protein YciS (DUF1049 family)
MCLLITKLGSLDTDYIMYESIVMCLYLLLPFTVGSQNSVVLCFHSHLTCEKFMLSHLKSIEIKLNFKINLQKYLASWIL